MEITEKAPIFLRRCSGGATATPAPPLATLLLRALEQNITPCIKWRTIFFSLHLEMPYGNYIETIIVSYKAYYKDKRQVMPVVVPSYTIT